MPAIAIFGAGGAIGRSVARELERRGISFRAAGRNQARLEQAFGGLRHAEIAVVDLAEQPSAEAAAQGCETIIYTVGVPYPAFHLHPRLMRTAVEAAAAMGVRKMVVVSSVYSYGIPETDRVAEGHPRRPHTNKGRMRKEQEDLVLGAHREGLLKTLVLRLPDFYGPHADLSLANPIFRAALDGQTANWLGPVDAPHEFAFVPDTGALIADLADREDLFGEAWNMGGAGTITGREFISEIYRQTGRQPRWRTAGKTLLRVMGLFNPLMKELVEMHYLQKTPVILDDSRLRARLGEISKTPYGQGIRLTLEWMRGG